MEIIREVVAGDGIERELCVNKFCIHRGKNERHAKTAPQYDEGVFFKPCDSAVDMHRIEMVEVFIEREMFVANDERDHHFAEIIGVSKHIGAVVLPHHEIKKHQDRGSNARKEPCRDKRSCDNKKDLRCVRGDWRKEIGKGKFRPEHCAKIA